MSKSSSSRKKSSDVISKRGRPRQVRLGFASPKMDKVSSSFDKASANISQEEFEKQISANSFENTNIDASKNKDSTFIENNKINDLLLQIDLLEKKIKTLEDSNQVLKSELDKQNLIFLEKIQQKTEQAQKLVDEKIAFYEAKKNEEVAKIRLSVFEDVASAFLDPIILLQSIVASSPSDPVVANYLQGFTMLLNQFDDKLNELGVDEINVNVGDAFNELYMEAFDVVENSDYPPNTVIKIVKKGFVVNETKVLKHTLVVVSK